MVSNKKYQFTEKSPHYCSACEAELNKDTPPSGVPVAATGMSDQGHGQGESTYEDILPHVKDEGRAIELEMNVAYSTTTVSKSLSK